MRIAHVSDCYLPRVGGIELHLHDLAHRQAAAGHTVTVVTATALSDDASCLGSVTVEHPGTRRLGGKAGMIRYTRSLTGRDHLRNGHYDVVHVHASAFSPLAFLAARDAARRGIPTAATLHSLWAQSAPLFRIADRVTGWGSWPVAWSAVSAAAAQSPQRLLAGRAGVAIVPNGIDAHWWAPTAPRLQSEEVRLVSVMRLAPRKRPLELLRVLASVRDSAPQDLKLSVDLIGDGPERTSVERYLHRHKMHSWVRLHGNLPRPQIRSLHSRADLFVSAATLESFGIAALEARCAGVPVISRGGTGVEEFILHGRDGLLLDSDEAMVKALVGLVGSREAIRQLADGCRVAPRGVSWDDVLTCCDALYLEARLLQTRGPTTLPTTATREMSGASA